MPIKKYLLTTLILLAGTFAGLTLLTGLAFAGEDDPLAETRRLALSGTQDAQIKMGESYEHGENVAQDTQQAIKWYCKAAVKGNPKAQRNLAWLYANGRGVERNDAIAAHWYAKAAKSGDVFSSNMLERMDVSQGKYRNICPTGTYIASSPVWESNRCGKSCQSVVALVEKLAPEYGLNQRLVLSVIQQESGFNRKARSPKNAQGLMQLIPATQKRFNVKNPWDAEQNLRGGMAYLRYLINYFKGDVSLALAAYNAGENKVERYNGIPPYNETRNYVKVIISLYGSEKHSWEETVSMSALSNPGA